MKQVRIKNIIELSLAMIVLSNCSKNRENDNCISYAAAPILTVSGPDSASINQDIIFTISFGISNGCAGFGNIEQIFTGVHSTSVKVNAKYEGCACTQIAGSLQTTYSFRATEPAVYYFKFFRENNDYLIDSVVIQ